MSVTARRTAARWLVPGAVIAIAIGAAAVTAVAADAPPTLPTRSAAELLVDVQGASVAGMSGTVVQTSVLGMPELPIQVGQGSSSFTSLISGTHTLRVWYAGTDQQRIALLGTLGESDIVRNGSDVWTWASDTNTATHYQLPAGQRPTGALAPDPADSGPPLTPQDAANEALAAIDPTTTVSTDGTAQVAGRPAYELVLAPKDSASLIGQVRIAIDAEQHIPLRVQVLANGSSTPAFELGFSQVSFDVPAAEQFNFTAPAGATVTESSPTAPSVAGGADPTAPAATATAAAEADSKPQVIGSGWTSIVVVDTAGQSLSAPTAPEGGSGTDGQETAPRSAMSLSGVLASLPTVSGAWGSGRLLQSTLFSALLTDDGRLFVGAVAPDALYKAATQ